MTTTTSVPCTGKPERSDGAERGVSLLEHDAYVKRGVSQLPSEQDDHVERGVSAPSQHIPHDLLRNIRTVIAHGREEGPCADGLAAALIVRDVLPDVAVRFVTYESAEHRQLVPEPGVLFVDIAPVPDRVEDWLAADAIVLDHHRSARDVAQRFEVVGHGVYSEEPGLSAATLAYREVWSHLAPLRCTFFIERFASLAGVYDTWQREDPLWEDAAAQTAALYFYPVDEWLSHRVLIGGPEFRQRMELGPLLLRKNRDSVRELVAGAYHFITGTGTRVAVLPSTFLISDAADAVSNVDVVAGFSFRVRQGMPSMKVSFRSRGPHLVRAIAEALGGGGHDRAASAWLELHESHRHPYQVIRTIMEAW